MRALTSGVVAVLSASVLALGAAEAVPPLVEAVKTGNTQRVRALVKQGADVNAAEPDGMTALHWAVRANDGDTAQLLIRAGANVRARDRYGITALTLAAVNGNAPVIESLIRAGADPNTATPEGETALMTAARTGRPEAVKVLVALGANVNATEKWQGQTALMWAAAENNAAAVRLLMEVGSDANVHSTAWTFPEYRYQTNGMAVFLLPRGGWTALMYAARQNAKEAATALADMKADLNAVDAEGTTALHLAVINVHYDLAALLLQKGADPNIQDATGMTPLYAAVDMRAPANMMTRPNPKIADREELDALGIVRVLLEHAADPNMALRGPIIGRHNNLLGDTSLGLGATPLARAAKANDLPVMRLLLDHGADPTLTLKDRTTTAMLASSLEAIQLLVERGVDVNAFNTNGQTLLHNAAGRGANPVITYLAGAGARLDRKDKRGRTALDIARGAGGGGGRGGGARVNEATAALLEQLMAAR